MHFEALQRAIRIKLSNEAIAIIKQGHCAWQTENGELIDIDTTIDSAYDSIKEEVNRLRGKDNFVYYGFKGYIQHVLPTNNYLFVSPYEEDWSTEITDTSFDGYPNLKIITLAVTSEMTHGTFDFGDAYVDVVNGRLTRIGFNELMRTSKTSVF